jgi:hypothetical protein
LLIGRRFANLPHKNVPRQYKFGGLVLSLAQFYYGGSAAAFLLRGWVVSSYMRVLAE